MAEAVLKTGNGVLVDKYAQKTALRLGVSPEAVRAEFKKAGRAQRAGPAAEEEDEAATEELPRPSQPEYWLLKLLFAHEDHVDWAAANLDPAWIQHPVVREIVSKRFAAQREESWNGVGAFLGVDDKPEFLSLITEITAEERTIPKPGQQLADIAMRLRNQFIDRQLQASIQKASQPEATEEERAELLRQQQQLRDAKRAPTVPPQ